MHAPSKMKQNVPINEDGEEDDNSFNKVSSHGRFKKLYASQHDPPDTLNFPEKKVENFLKEYFSQKNPFCGALITGDFTDHHKGKSTVRHLRYHGMTPSAKRKLGLLEETIHKSFFHFDEHAYDNIELRNHDLIDSSMPDCRLLQVSKQQFEIDLPLINNLTVSISGCSNNEGTSLTGNFKPIPYSHPDNRRDGFVFNTGGFPVATSWFDKTINDKKYLFVSVYSHGSHFDKPSDLNSTQLKKLALSYKEAFNSGLFIYELDLKNGTLTLNKKIYFNKGSIIKMKWLPCTELTAEENLLACVFQDGTAGIIKVNPQFLQKTDHLYYKLTRCSIELKVPDFKIYSMDWTSATTVVVGLNDGFIAELDLTRPDSPNYIQNLSLGTIYHISTCYSNKIFSKEGESLPNVAFIAPNNFQYYLVDLNDFSIMMDGARGREVYTHAEYSSLLDSFFYCDSRERAKSITLKEIELPIWFKMMEKQTTSIGVSDYSHLFLTGHLNGSIRVMNYYGKMITTYRSKDVSGHRSLRIFKMSRVGFKSDNKFHLSLNLLSDAKMVRMIVKIITILMCMILPSMLWIVL
ncbi:unnamed protein product [Ambrosiozyma monospora]|uniref:Unnamed protein product n=1 Tax=Ambrosiozyma monospora TaxID=43982 RepID=A0ACB5T8P9_AMBMO|nr:unnamed protein product [Ambrosiozyma monospora]